MGLDDGLGILIVMIKGYVLKYRYSKDIWFSIFGYLCFLIFGWFYRELYVFYVFVFVSGFWELVNFDLFSVFWFYRVSYLGFGFVLDLFFVLWVIMMLLRFLWGCLLFIERDYNERVYFFKV